MEAGSEVGYFVRVDLLSVLGSLYSWAFKRALSEVIGEVGVCREGGCDGAVGGTHHSAGSGCELRWWVRCSQGCSPIPSPLQIPLDTPAVRLGCLRGSSSSRERGGECCPPEAGPTVNAGSVPEQEPRGFLPAQRIAPNYCTSRPSAALGTRSEEGGTWEKKSLQ